MTSNTDAFSATLWSSKNEIEDIDCAEGSSDSDAQEVSGTLFLFLDESGNFDFGETGTDYFIMTCLVTRRPFLACHDLMDLKYDLFENGLTMKKFHATEDKADVRDAVYDVIEKHAKRFTAYSIYIDKRRLPEAMQSPDVLYANMFGLLTNEVLTQEAGADTDKVIVITDDIPKEAKRRQVEKPLKKQLKGFAKKTGTPCFLEHFPSESDFNLQVTDYLCWAFMRRKAKGYEWPYDRVESIFSETGDVFLIA